MSKCEEARGAGDISTSSEARARGREHRQRAAEAMRAKNFALAVSSLTAMLELLPPDHGTWWSLPVADPRRKTLATIYHDRSAAHAGAESWASSIGDAFEANRLSDRNDVAALELLAAAASALADQPQEITPSLLETAGVIESAAGREAAERSLQSTSSMLAHALVADVFAMLGEDAFPPGTPEAKAALEKRDLHVGIAGVVHPLGTTAGASVSASERARLNTMIIHSLLSEGSDTPLTRLVVVLIGVTCHRLGCTVPPLEWKPYHLLDSLREDRLVETWLKDRLGVVGQAPGQAAGAHAAERPRTRAAEGGGPAPHPVLGQLQQKATEGLARLRINEQRWLQQRVRITGLKTRPELNGEIGTVVEYDEARRRFGVAIDGAFFEGKSLGVRPENLLLLAELEAMGEVIRAKEGGGG
jgi:hypothetical protein